MRKIILIVLLFLSLPCFAQEELILNKPTVDKRVELLSIVFRLAGRSEYNMTYFQLYTDRIKAHFNEYKDHELILFSKEIIKNNYIGYDAVATMAICLDDKFDIVAENQLGSRWKGVDVAKYIKLLKKFVKDTKFEEFWKENSDLYLEVSNRFLPVYESIDLNWYKKFYGKTPSEKFIIINALGNGACCYGPSIENDNGDKNVYAIMGAWMVDSLGMATFRVNEQLYTLLHEFNHSFVNHLVTKYNDELKEDAQKVYAVVKDGMKSQAYGAWDVVVCESLVRAAVIKYMKDHNHPDHTIEIAMKQELTLGFLWMRELVAELDNYDKQRDIYPTLEDYMPKIVEAYSDYARIAIQANNKKPRVLSINEFLNGSQSVNAENESITINFDKPLSGIVHSNFYGRDISFVPKIESVVFSNDNKTITFKVKLEKDKQYSLTLSNFTFESSDGVGIQNYDVNFKTEK